MGGTDSSVVSNIFNDPGTALQVAGMVLPKYTYYQGMGRQFIPHTIDLRPGLEGLGKLYTQQATLAGLQKGIQSIPGMLNAPTTGATAAPPMIQSQYDQPSAGMELATAGNVPAPRPDLAAQAQQLAQPVQLPQLKDFLAQAPPDVLRAYTRSMTAGGVSPLESQFESMRKETLATETGAQAAKLRDVAAEALTRLRENPEDPNARAAYTRAMLAADDRGMIAMRQILSEEQSAQASMDFAESLGLKKSVGLTAAFAPIARAQFEQRQQAEQAMQVLESQRGSMPADQFQLLHAMVASGRTITTPELYKLIANPQLMQQEAALRKQFPDLASAYAASRPLNPQRVTEAAQAFPMLQPTLQKWVEESQKNSIEWQRLMALQGDLALRRKDAEQTQAYNRWSIAQARQGQVEQRVEALNRDPRRYATDPKVKAEWEKELAPVDRLNTQLKRQVDEMDRSYGMTYDQPGRTRIIQGETTDLIASIVTSSATPDVKIAQLEQMRTEAFASPELTSPEFKPGPNLRQFIDQQINEAQAKVRSMPMTGGTSVGITPSGGVPLTPPVAGAPATLGATPFGVLEEGLNPSPVQTPSLPQLPSPPNVRRWLTQPPALVGPPT